MNGRVAGKVAFITGAASGFGRQSAIRLSEQGAAVVITDVDREGLEETRQLLGGDTVASVLDVSSQAQWNEVFDAAMREMGRLDVLLNCAGNAPGPDNIEECSDEMWDSVMDVHLTGTFLGCQKAVSVMKRGAGGSIINLSSVLGNRGYAGSLAYSAAKGAIRLMTKSVAIHCGRCQYQIRCNSIHPGYMMTPMVTSWLEAQDDPQALYDELVEHHPIGRLGDADDVAQMVVYLASDESKFVTGAEMMVDGGYTAM